MDLEDKHRLLHELRARLAAQYATLVAAQKSAQEGAVHPDAKAEHSKDTRSIESGYLARGLAERAETLRDGLRALDLLRLREFGDDDAATVGAVVTLASTDGRETHYFLAPSGAGETIRIGLDDVVVLTPRSPLGVAMSGRRAGDSVRAELPTGLLLADVDRVR